MSDDGILHFNPWMDFNDGPPSENPFGCDPDPEQIAVFLDTVFSWCEGLIPLRGFVDKGQGRDGKPHNIWIPADETAPGKLATFAGWANREGAAVYVIPGTVEEQGQARAADVLQMQAIVVDLDAGDIPAKLDHVTRHLGAPTLIIESGGRTPEGAAKLHVWWKLTEPAESGELATLCHLRGEIAVKVGGDTHFRSAHQPIRVPGTVYHKHGHQRLVQIREHRDVEVDLADFAEKVGEMPPLPGVGFASDVSAPQAKPDIDAVLTTPVREGAVDDWSRFQGASAAIGHYVRLVHEGRLDPFAGWEAICGYNAAMLRPSWPLDRLMAESERLWALHVKRNGPPLLRAAPADAPASPLPTFSLGALLDDTSPMPEDVIAYLRWLKAYGFAALDMTQDDLARDHIRYMVGGVSSGAADERLLSFTFPERPGALMKFLAALRPGWNISLFHYRNQGADYGRILVGLQAPESDRQAFQEFLETLSYPYVEETENPVYRLFLR